MKVASKDKVSIGNYNQLNANAEAKEQTLPPKEGSNQKFKKDTNRPIFRDLGKKEKYGVL
jgi:hypothetical protein